MNVLANTQVQINDAWYVIGLSDTGIHLLHSYDGKGYSILSSALLNKDKQRENHEVSPDGNGNVTVKLSAI